MSLHPMEYALYGPQTRMKYMLTAIGELLAVAVGNQMNQLPLFQQAFHVKCAMRDLTLGRN
jgi:hypothetical protein